LDPLLPLLEFATREVLTLTDFTVDETYTKFKVALVALVVTLVEFKTTVKKV